MKSKIKQGEITPKMFSLTWRKQQLATDLLLAYPRSKQPKGLLHVFPSQSCLQSFALPSGTFLPMISSDVWRYFGISTLSLEGYQSTSPEWLLWSAALAPATAFLILYRSLRFLPTQSEAGDEAHTVCSYRRVVFQFDSASASLADSYIARQLFSLCFWYSCNQNDATQPLTLKTAQVKSK